VNRVATIPVIWESFQIWSATYSMPLGEMTSPL
jgi:hypothetical protein